MQYISAFSRIEKLHNRGFGLTSLCLYSQPLPRMDTQFFKIYVLKKQNKTGKHEYTGYKLLQSHSYPVTETGFTSRLLSCWAALGAGLAPCINWV